MKKKQQAPKAIRAFARDVINTSTGGDDTLLSDDRLNAVDNYLRRRVATLEVEQLAELVNVSRFTMDEAQEFVRKNPRPDIREAREALETFLVVCEIYERVQGAQT